MKTDLATEFSRCLIKNKDYKKNVKVVNKNLKIVITEITTEKASNFFSLEKGTYGLIEMPFEPELQELERKNIEKELKNLLKKILEKSDAKNIKSALIVGLGNPKMIADCFGGKVIEKIVATRPLILAGILENNGIKKESDVKNVRNMKNNNNVQKKWCSVSKIGCDVFGKTGMESFDVIKGVVDMLKPEIVVLIDTLVAGSYKRLCSNIQIANVGIVPGSGVDNARKEISQKTLETKVITIGVPFVVYVEDIVAQKIGKDNKKVRQGLRDISNLIVMPREIEQQLKFCSSVVASAINCALNPSFSKNDWKKICL